MAYSDYFSRDPEIMAGKTVIKGTRVTIKQLMLCLAQGNSREWILGAFPQVSPEALEAVIQFAADAAQDDVPVLEPQKSA